MVMFRRYRRWRLLCTVILALCLIVSCLIQLIVFSNTIYCLGWKTKQIINDLCKDYENGLIAGRLCDDFCHKSSELTLQSCYAPHLAKAVVFTAQWREWRTMVVKSNYADMSSCEPFPAQIDTEQGFGKSVAQLASIIKDTINVIVGDEALGFHVNEDYFIRSILTKDFGLPDINSDVVDNSNATLVKNKDAVLRSLWSLIQQKEYLTFKSLENSGLFPHVIGSCGHLYAVEYHRPVTEFLRSNWKLRAEIALAIFSWLETAQFYYNQPIRICDVKINHFGVVESNGFLSDVRFLDADDVYFQPTLNTVVQFQNECRSHLHCSYFDCQMDCDIRRSVCDTSRINNNLQVVCAKLFLEPSTIAAKVFKPNFLHSLPISKSGEVEALSQLFYACSRSNSTLLNFHEFKTFLKKLLINNKEFT